jgi:hypothetical protein
LKRRRKLFYEFHDLAGVLGQIFKDVHFERKKNPVKNDSVACTKGNARKREK